MESPQISVCDEDRSYKIYNMYKFTSKERRVVDALRLKFFLINAAFYLCWLPNLINGLLVWTMWFNMPVKVIIAIWYIMRPENLETSLSSRDTKTVYAMNDQTFHTPSFGDEEFDIPLIHGQHAASAGGQGHLQYTQLHHSAPQVGMMNPAQDGLAPPGGAPSFQQPLYLQEPHTPVTSHSAGAPAGNYIIQQQPGGQQQLLMMQPSQVLNGPPTPSTPSQPAPVYGSPQRASPPGTTSDDSDDSVPSHSQLPGDAESLLPIHYCSASRQQQTTLHQMGVTNMGVKRSSPEPMDNGMNRGQMQKKPKVQKKKKKRDPNEPQKPVSAYALFFRDTQAAIKGQNPNASFGEVSKIVASMWDGLDSEHKSVYKQKTEVAKKEYLKALAAYRASLVSKSGEAENPVMYNHNNTNPNYGSYYSGQAYGNGHSPQGYVPNSTPQGYTPQNFPGQTQSNYAGGPPQTYPNNPQQSPQNYQGNIPHPGANYQGVSAQASQGYQVNAGSSPQNCQPNMAQSPRNYQNAQSPSYVASAAISPPGYRQVQSQSPPMAAVHTPMQYHHSQQMQQAHQVQQYQQQQQIQNQQQPQQHQHPHQQQQQQKAQLQHQQTTQQQHQQQPQQQQQNQQHHQQPQQHHQQSQQQPQQSQPPSQNSNNQNDQQSPSGNGNPGVPQQSPEQSENRSTQSCIREGCKNPAIANSGWEDEYCSNECVVNHCRDVFSSWVASNTNNQMQNFSAVK